MGYKNIRTTGDTSVKAIVGSEIPRGDCCVFLLMGPTGSGKSSFIEALANNSGLGIAKDQLDGFTQDLTVYRLINMQQVEHPANPLLIIDTPGFADRRLPESKTLRLVQQWLKKHKLYFAQILYFDRITDTRMAGSKGKLLDMFKAITGEDTGKTISITTTMWDQLWKDDQVKRANKRFAEMSTVYYKDFVDDGARVIKFENTHESALSIVDDCLDNFSTTYFKFELMALRNTAMSSTSFCRFLHANLLERQAALLQHLNALDDDLTAIHVKSNPELGDSLLKQKAEAMNDLAVIEEELQGFPDLPPQEVIPSPRRDLAGNRLREHSKTRALTHDAVVHAAITPPSTPHKVVIFRLAERVTPRSSGRMTPDHPIRPQSAPPESSPLKVFLGRGTQQLKTIFQAGK